MISADAIRTSHSTTIRRVDLAGLFDRFPRLEGAVVVSVRFRLGGRRGAVARPADARVGPGDGQHTRSGGSRRCDHLGGIGIGLRAGRVRSSVDGHGAGSKATILARGWTITGSAPGSGRRRPAPPRRRRRAHHGRQRAELQQETLEEGRTTDGEHDLVATVAERPGGVLGEALDHPRRLGREAQGDPGIGRVGPVHEVAEIVGRRHDRPVAAARSARRWRAPRGPGRRGTGARPPRGGTRRRRTRRRTRGKPAAVRRPGSSRRRGRTSSSGAPRTRARRPPPAGSRR